MTMSVVSDMFVWIDNMGLSGLALMEHVLTEQNVQFYINFTRVGDASILKTLARNLLA